jgi:hypothetical protein
LVSRNFPPRVNFLSEKAVAEIACDVEDLGVARDGIELPARGFLVLVP